MKIVRETLPKMTCSFCSLYFKCNDDSKINAGKACSKFGLRKFFYCNKNNCTIDVVVCISRQDKTFYGCGNCKQGKMLGSYLKQKGDSHVG